MRGLNTLYFAFLMLLMAVVSLDSGWAQPQEVVFNFTGGQQSFVVPNGVFTIHIQAWGAQGADTDFVFPEPGGTSPGGLGGFAEGDLDVNPGQTLEIFVGGQGTAVDDFTFGGGGFNGGGNAFARIPPSERGGGGGASDVRVGAASLDDRVIVAAGGGGATAVLNSFGGNGGGLVGSDGGVTPGGGGTQTTGGTGLNPVTLCGDGEFGLGGNATDAAAAGSCAGGGGGWYGGGTGNGAGGGSSYIDGVTNGNTTSGVREGDGMVVLTFTPRVNIPTLSEWGLIAMAGVLGIIGLLAIRRRKAAA